MLKYFQVPLEKLPIMFSEPPGIPNRIAISLAPGYKIDFTQYDFRKIVGFDAKVYEEIDNIGDFNANVENDVEFICIHCSLVRDALIHNIQLNKCVRGDVIFAFIPDREPNEWLIYKPNPLEKYSISDMNVKTIELRITDQDNNRIDFNGESALVKLEISYI